MNPLKEPKTDRGGIVCGLVGAGLVLCLFWWLLRDDTLTGDYVGHLDIPTVTQLPTSQMSPAMAKHLEQQIKRMRSMTKTTLSFQGRKARLTTLAGTTLMVPYSVYPDRVELELSSGAVQQILVLNRLPDGRLHSPTLGHLERVR